MIIDLKEYPELVKTLKEDIKLEKVLSEKVLEEISESLLEDFKSESWLDWDDEFEGIGRIHSEELRQVLIMREAYTKVLEVMDSSLGEFDKLYPYYIDSNDKARKEWNSYMSKVDNGKAVITLYKGEDING